MKNKIADKLIKMMDVNTPIIYIQEYDFWRIDNIIKEAVGQAKIEEWNPTTGITNFDTKLPIGNDKAISLEEYLINNIYNRINTQKELICVLKDVHKQLEDERIFSTLHLIAQRKLYDSRFNITVIIVSPEVCIPKEIEKYISFLEIDFPSEEEITELINLHMEINQYDKAKFTAEDKEKLMPTLKGLTFFEIDRMLDVAMSSNGSLSADDSDMILAQKKAMVKKSGLLELVDTKEKIENIGGLEVLKEYLKKKAEIIKNFSDARKSGVDTPKGVFIVGMPGCGKSLCAKVSASLFNAPLLKLDMGSMMGKYVGESEKNLRKAIKIAEAAAPCVLWIDEIEKGFSGVNGSSGENSTLMRMFGYFLSWMQDKETCVYVMATANNAQNLPPELKRKGRFDEIFCVNLPNQKEREAIFKISLSKGNRKNYPKNFNLEDSSILSPLVQATNGFNGADIDAIVNESIENSYTDNKSELTIEKIRKVITSTHSISSTCKAQIDSMTKIFKDNLFKNASI